uniref:MAM domain-containing protein n=1 Tax=Romanomermis culicivorax TaxID=13658 RepID=A0A915IBD2_ROMCU
MLQIAVIFIIFSINIVDNRKIRKYCDSCTREVPRLTNTIASTTWVSIYGCNKGSSNPTQGVIQRLVGKDVSTTDYATDGYKGGPISQGSDLNCDFSSQCCWKDASSGSGIPEVEKYRLVQYCYKNEFSRLLRFQNIVSHWTTKNVVIKVCTQPDGSNSPQNCQTLPSSSPGPDTVTLPAVTQLSDLVIVASGFSEKSGSVAMIDDIKVNAQVCPITTTTVTTTTTTMATTAAPVCTKVQCNFESSMDQARNTVFHLSNSACSYTDAISTGDVPGVNQKWQTVSGQYQNRATGIDKAGEGQYYMATYLTNMNDAAALETNVNFDQDRVVRFLAYRATEGIDLQCCCDNVNSCIYNMGKNVQIADFRNWRTVSVKCPAGTKKVIMYAKNSGKNQGAVGLDNIQVLIPSGGSPDQATAPAC